MLDLPVSMSTEDPTPTVGSRSSDDELYAKVYEELRKLAAAKMARESPLSTLQATALVHEAWLRLGGDRQPQWENKAHFFSAAAEAMRRILIDKARKKKTLRHGGNQVRVDFDSVSSLHSDSEDDQQIIALNDALERFSQFQPKKAELVKLRYFIGLTIEEAANALGISKSTAKNWWSFSKAWLFEEISSSSNDRKPS